MLGLFLQSSGVVCVHIEDGKPAHIHVFHHTEEAAHAEHACDSTTGGLGYEACDGHHCDSKCQMVSVSFRTFESVEALDFCPFVTWVGVPVCARSVPVFNTDSWGDFLSPECPMVLRV